MCLSLTLLVTDLMEDETLREEARNASGLESADFSLEDFTYQNHVVQRIMMKHLTDTNFTGVTVSPSSHQSY